MLSKPIELRDQVSLTRFLQVNSIPKTQTRLEGPGEVPPVARILMCRAVIPSSLHRVATSWAANIAAYGELSSRSALTFIPPVLSTVPYTTTTTTTTKLRRAGGGCTGDSDDGFLPRQIGDVDESIIERGKDMSDSEDKFTFPDLRTEADDLFL